MRKAIKITAAALAVLSLASAAFAASFSGNLRRAGDRRGHWVRLYRNEETHFKLRSWPESARFDMQLFDGEGRLVKQRIARGDGPEMSYRPDSGGWYRLVVTSARGGGDYELRVN